MSFVHFRRDVMCSNENAFFELGAIVLDAMQTKIYLAYNCQMTFITVNEAFAF